MHFWKHNVKKILFCFIQIRKTQTFFQNFILYSIISHFYKKKRKTKLIKHLMRWRNCIKPVYCLIKYQYIYLCIHIAMLCWNKTTDKLIIFFMLTYESIVYTIFLMIRIIFFHIVFNDNAKNKQKNNRIEEIVKMGKDSLLASLKKKCEHKSF